MFNKTKRLLALILVTVIVVGMSLNVQSVYAETTSKVTINNPKEILPEGSIPDGYTIIGYPNSTAEEYANKFGNSFQDINKEEQLESKGEVGIETFNIEPNQEGSTLTFYHESGDSYVKVHNKPGVSTYMTIHATSKIDWVHYGETLGSSYLDAFRIVWPDGTIENSSYYRYDVRGPGRYSILLSWSGHRYYTETIEFILEESFTNSKPTITSTNTSQTVGANKTVTLTGTAQDLDNDTLTVSATINNITKTQSITNTSTSKPYTLTWNSNEISNGTYTNIPVTATDDIATSTTNYTGTIKVDKTLPVITTSIVPTSTTSKDVTITATTTKGTLNKASHTFTQNGSFTFTATDAFGNTASKEVTVGNIDKVPQKITINPYDTLWTNKDIIVTATTDKGTLNKSTHTFTENNSTTFTASYIDAPQVSQKVTITNIDKVIPTKPTFNRTGENLTVTLGTDALSGIKEHKFSTNGTSWNTYTTPINLKMYDDGTYTFRVKAIDNAGNESAEDTITVTLTYLADATAVVVTAENSLLESDYNLAVNAVNYLESSEGKKGLEERLIVVLNKINFIKGLDSTIESLTTIDINWNNVDNIRDNIGELPAGAEKTRLEAKLQARVDGIYAVLVDTATTAVEKAEEFKDYQDYTDATTKVNLVPTGAERTELEGRLNAVQSKYDQTIAEATSAVVIAEEYLTREDYTNARATVDAMPTCAEKNSLTIRLDVVEQRYQNDLVLAENAVAKAEMKEEMSDLDLAQEAIDVLPTSTDKTQLQDRLDSLILDIEAMHAEATTAVGKAEEYLTREDYTSADDLVSKLPNGSEKDELRARLDAVESKYQKDLQIAIGTVEVAEGDEGRDDYYYAVGKVEKLPFGDDRTELEDRLTIVNDRYLETIREVEKAVVKAEEKIDREDYYDAITKVGTMIQGPDKTLFEERLTVVEADFIRDLALATEAVEKAEEYLTREDYDNAFELVSKLPSGDGKTELEERLKEVNERYNEDLQAATEAVEKVEDTIDLEDYDNAKELVNKLPAGEDKTELEDRLNKVDEEYKDALDKAKESVEKAEEGISREDYENARDEVNALPPGNGRDDLEERLDAVEDKYQTDLEEATEAVEKAEEYLDREDYDNAKDKVDNLPDGNEKEELKDRLEEVNDKYKEDLAKSTEAVEKAEDTLKQEDIDSAQGLVNKLPTGQDKQDLQDRLDRLQQEVDNSLREATEAVEKVEETLDRNDLEDAKDKVDKLPEGTVKDDLIDRLEKVEEEINRIEKEKEDLIREATEAVEKAEETLKREDHTTAQGKVDLLEPGQVKNDLQERLDKLLEAIKAKEESEAGSSGNSGSGSTTVTSVEKDKNKEALEKELQKRIEELSEELLERLPFTIPIEGFSLEELLKLLDDSGISYEGIPMEALTEIALGVQTLELKIGSKVLSEEVEGVSVSDREEIVFKDIQVNHWAKDSIAEATRKGYLVGTEEGVYSPNIGLKFSDTYVAMNRVFIAHKNLSSVMSRSDAEKLTDDISKEHWAYFGFNSIVSKMDVDYATELLPKDSNIINKVITREEIAKTIQAVLLGGEITNNNQTAIEYVNEIGVMVGDEKGNFNPDKGLTRAELAAVIMRLDKIVSANK